jgi:ketosteroid isomerase-like protein
LHQSAQILASLRPIAGPVVDASASRRHVADMSAADVIRTHYESATQGDLDGMLAPLAPDASWTEAVGFPYAGTYTGPGEVAEGVFARIAADWEGYRFELEELVDGGTTVVGVGTYSGVFRATGRAMTARVAHVWHVRDDRVTRFEQIVDSVPVAAAMDDVQRADAA